MGRIKQGERTIQLNPLYNLAFMLRWKGGKKLQEWTSKKNRGKMDIKNFYFTYLWYDRNDSEKKVHARISARPTIPETPFSYNFFLMLLYEKEGKEEEKKRQKNIF